MLHKAVIQASAIEDFLAKRPGLSHIKVRARGNLITLESIDEEGIVYPHARFKRKGEAIHKWMLEMPARRWEVTFIEGTLTELMETLVEKFPWTLAEQ